MRIRGVIMSSVIVLCGLLPSAATAQTRNQSSSQSPGESRFVVDIAVGIDPTINGNVNSGAIGTLNGQSTAILPNSYGNVYGTGTHLRFGGGYKLDDQSELRGIFTWQSADADLVRLGDIGASSLYAQYSDYKSLGLDLGYRRYLATTVQGARLYGEATIGAAFIDRINSTFAAPQSNVVFNSTDFYDRTAAFTWGLNVGALFKIASQVDVSAEIGLWIS
jgi:hypothetical protein